MRKFKRLAAVLLLAGLLLSLTGCSSARKLIGTWQSKPVVGVNLASFTFNKDGTGKMNVAVLGESDFTYKAEKNVVSITYTVLGVSKTIDLEFEVEDKVLKLSGAGLTFELEKQ